MRAFSSGRVTNTITEFRRVSVVFVNLNLSLDADKADSVHAAMRIMQECIYEYEGTVRQFLFDDKGSVLIAAFGVPPKSHEDDPIRAIRSSLKINQRLKKEIGITNSIGITTGTVFCGAVGSPERREYAVVGDSVVWSFYFLLIYRTLLLGLWVHQKIL